MLSHEEGRHFVLNFTIKLGKSTVIVEGGCFSVYFKRQGGDVDFTSKLSCEVCHMRGFHIYIYIYIDLNTG